MATKHPATENHTIAAEHHRRAAEHHDNAARLNEEGKHQDASHHAKSGPWSRSPRRRAFEDRRQEDERSSRHNRQAARSLVEFFLRWHFFQQSSALSRKQ